MMRVGGWARGDVTIYAEPLRNVDVVQILRNGLFAESLGSDDGLCVPR